MVLERDLDRGVSEPYIIINIYDEEDEELIAHLVETTHVPLPNEGEKLQLEGAQFTEEDGTDTNPLGTYVVEEKEFKYSLTRPSNLESQEADRLFVLIQFTVTPL